jgi:hypothetical protein
MTTTENLQMGKEYFLDSTKEEIGLFRGYEINGTPLFEGKSDYYLSNDNGLMPIRSINGFEPVIIYKSAVKAGRCFNGAHRDSGVIVHAIPEDNINGPNFKKALCGTSPGIRGYGWNDSINKDINCSKCLKKINLSNGTTKANNN